MRTEGHDMGRDAADSSTPGRPVRHRAPGLRNDRRQRRRHRRVPRRPRRFARDVLRRLLLPGYRDQSRSGTSRTARRTSGRSPPERCPRARARTSPPTRRWSSRSCSRVIGQLPAAAAGHRRQQPVDAPTCTRAKICCWTTTARSTGSPAQFGSRSRAPWS